MGGEDDEFDELTQVEPSGEIADEFDSAATRVQLSSQEFAPEHLSGLRSRGATETFDDAATRVHRPTSGDDEFEGATVVREPLAETDREASVQVDPSLRAHVPPLATASPRPHAARSQAPGLAATVVREIDFATRKRSDELFDAPTRMHLPGSAHDLLAPNPRSLGRTNEPPAAASKRWGSPAGGRDLPLAPTDATPAHPRTSPPARKSETNPVRTVVMAVGALVVAGGVLALTYWEPAGSVDPNGPQADPMAAPSDSPDPSSHHTADVPTEDPVADGPSADSTEGDSTEGDSTESDPFEPLAEAPPLPEAASLAANGQYREAARAYAALAREHPDRPEFAVMARILRDKAAAER